MVRHHFLRKTIPALAMFTLVLGTANCGKDDDDDDKGKPIRLRVEASSAGAGSGLLADVGDFRPDSTIGGAPTSLTIFITKMALVGTDGSSATKATIFENSDGKPIRITDSSADISDMFTTFACLDSAGEPVDTGGEECPCGVKSTGAVIAENDDGTCPELAAGDIPPYAELDADEGTYTSLEVTYKRAAEAKGCVTATFSSSSAVPGEHTYCTRTDHHTFQSPAGGKNSDFEDKAAQVMLFDLTTSSDGEFTTEQDATFDKSYAINSAVEVGGETTPQITLLIDTNRMLRFFNQGRSDTGPNPGMPTDRSYFYSTVFDSSAYVFVGAPGSIKGFSWATEACTGDATPPTDHVCTDNDATIVAGWLTMVFDSSGKPFLFNLMPDDDNTLTVIKGGNVSSSGYDATAIEAQGDGVYDLTYDLGDDGSGTLFNIDTSIAVDAASTDGYFEGLQDSYGTINLTRGL